MAAVPRLAAAVSEAGALGMVTLTWSADAGAAVGETAALTGRPFGGNFVLTEDHHRRLDQALEAGLRIVSFMWGDPGGYIEPVHAAGGIVLHTAGSAEEARRAAGSGVDVVVAQGWGGRQRWPVDRRVQAVAVSDPGDGAVRPPLSSAVLTAAENRAGVCITMSIMNTRPLSRSWLACRSRSAMACRMSLTVFGRTPPRRLRTRSAAASLTPA